MRYQRFEWSCGAACVINALKCFGTNVAEARAGAAAGTLPPSKCAHCRKLSTLIQERTCKKSRWKCTCDGCREIRRVWGQDCDSGTSEDGIVRALRKLAPGSLSVYEYDSESMENAWQWLHGTLIHGRVAILCLDSWHHWALAFSTSGDRVSVFDPYPSNKNKLENGLHILDKPDLMRRWWNARQHVGSERRLYAISVGKK